MAEHDCDRNPMPSWAGVRGGHQILDAYVPLIRDFAVKPRSATRQGFDPGISWRKYRQLPSISGRNGYVWTCFGAVVGWLLCPLAPPMARCFFFVEGLAS